MTKIIKADLINEAASCIAEGGIVAFPTETVYGLGADAFNDAAIDRIYKAKGRPSDNPLIVHIAQKEQIYNLVDYVPKKAEALMNKFWPGPLTIILPKMKTVPYRVTGGLDTIAIRCPDNPIALELIAKSGKSIAAPSANLSGSPSPTNIRHVIADLNNRVDYIIESDDCKIGLESTVLDLSSDKPLVLRPGAVTVEMLKELIPDVRLDDSLLDNNQKPKCPGMKYKHYSPKATVEVVCGEKDSVRNYIASRISHEKNIGVLTYKGGDYEDVKCVLSGGYSMTEFAQRLFYNLRVFDEYSVSKVYVEFCEEEGIGVAVKNRLYKAANRNITRV